MKINFIKFMLLFCILSSYCLGYEYSDIYIKNDNHPPKEIKALLQSYKNRQMNNIDLNFLLKNIKDLYSKNGNIISSISVDLESINKDILILNVNKVYINKIISDKNYFQALTFKEKEILDMHKIDQFVENLKTNLSEPKIAVVPSEIQDCYNIIIQTQREKQFEGYIMLDNDNYKDYGRENAYLGATRDNIILPGDILSLNLKERITKERKNHKERSYGINYSVPIKSWKLNYNFSHEETEDRILNGNYKSQKDENTHNIEISKIYFRNADTKLEMFFGLKLKDTKNYFDNIKLDVSSKKHNSIIAGTRMTRYVENGILYAEPSIEKGVALFGGDGNKGDEQGDLPFDKEFLKYNFNVYFNKSFYPTKYGYFNYTFNINGSYSKDHLLDANKFEMGGSGSIRGFKENTVKGDKGVYISNTLSFERKMISPFVGLDFGLSRDYYREDDDKMIGAAAGVKFVKNDFSASLTFSKPLLRAKDMPKESNPIYFKISYNF